MADDGDGDRGGDDGASLTEEVSKYGVVVVRDPELLHGHYICRRCLDGHMVAEVVDTDTQLVTVVDVLRANAWYSMWALNPVKKSEDSDEALVAKAIGDPAGGDRGVRRESAEAGRQAGGPGPGHPIRKYSHKEDCVVNLVEGSGMSCRAC